MDSVFAIVLFVALVFQVGASFGVPEDPRPMTSARGAVVIAGCVIVVCAVVLAIHAL